MPLLTPRTLNLRNVRKRPSPLPSAPTPLLVEDGKLLPPDVEFTAEMLLKWLEGLADKHEKGKMHDNAWAYVQALVKQDVTNRKELLEMQEYLREKNNLLLTHVAIIRAAIGTDEAKAK